MDNTKANRLDKVRAAAIYNTTKRINDAKEKQASEIEKARIAKEMTEARQPKSDKLVEKEK